METHSHPFGEAGAAGMDTAKEVSVLCAKALNYAVRAWARRQQANWDKTRARIESLRAEARAVYSPFLDPRHRRNATVDEALDAWYAAGPYSGTGTDAAREAARALDGAEEVMRRENPYAMARYKMRLDDGMSRPEAMKATIPDFAWNGDPDDPRPGRGMTEADARALQGAIEAIAEASEHPARAGRGPLTPQEAARMAGSMRGLPPGMARQIADGLAGGTVLRGSAPASVADTDPAVRKCFSGQASVRSRTGRKNPHGKRPARNRANTRTKERRYSGLPT